MKPDDIINQAIDYASEYLEMVEEPYEIVVGILAHKIIKLQDHINYLEKRLSHDSNR